MKSKSKIRMALLAILLMVTIPIAAYAADGQIKIAQTPSTTFPIVIDKPGSYVLTSNITLPTAINVHGIEITTDNVTIDFNGHFLIGPGGYLGFGIYAYNKDNIAVMNGTLRDFHTGVRLENGSNYRVKDISVYNTSQGITIEGSGMVTDCVASEGHTGFFLHKCTVTNCTAKDNSAWGMGVENCVVANCAVIHNGWTGIDASNSTLTTCIANSNHYNGSAPYGAGIEAKNSTITNCTASGNSGNGICAQSGSRIEGNNLRDNTKYGLYLMQGQNYAIKNVGSNNTSGNFHADNPSDNYMPASLTAPDAANANMSW